MCRFLKWELTNLCELYMDDTKNQLERIGPLNLIFFYSFFFKKEKKKHICYQFH